MTVTGEVVFTFLMPTKLVNYNDFGLIYVNKQEEGG